MLISQQLIAEVTKPQAPYTHEVIRATIEEVAQSSIMRLDSTSMDRLWDLITMVFKWQASLLPSIIGVTLRHLYELETYTLNEDTHLQLHKVQNVIENFNVILSQNEKHELRQELLGWLQCFNIRVSLLLRLGLQSQDGSFIFNSTDPIASRMLKNLGENIYFVTQREESKELHAQQNVQHHEDKIYRETKETKETDNELQIFADQMLGDRKLSTGSAENVPTLKLLIDDNTVNNKDEIRIEIFDNIDASLSDGKLQKIFDEMNIEDLEVPSVKEDLLNIIGTETV